MPVQSRRQNTCSRRQAALGQLLFVAAYSWTIRTVRNHRGTHPELSNEMADVGRTYFVRGLRYSGSVEAQGTLYEVYTYSCSKRLGDNMLIFCCWR